MRIILINPYYSEGMGYLENCLPKALSHLGHQVYVVTSIGQVYFNSEFYKDSYEKFLGPPIVDPIEKEIDGYNLIRLPFKLVGGKVILKGLSAKIKEIKPHIVQTFDPLSFLNIRLILSKPFNNYIIFTANHIMMSVFPIAHKENRHRIIHRLAFFISRTLPGILLNKFIEKSFPITIDAEYISNQYYSVPKKKLKVIPLGVDTQLFSPPNTIKLQKQRESVRQDLGIKKDEILCIYSGRFTKGKNPLCLAKAIEKLRESGEKYKALFIGSGDQKEEIMSIEGCIVKDFVLFEELAPLYRAADIGVWPREESTSMLDASASGLPLIISNTVQAKERVDGIGLEYSENNIKSMSETLLKLNKTDIREKLGKKGVERMRNEFSWLKMAEIRISEFNKAIELKTRK